MYTPFEVFLRKKFKFDSSSRSSSNEEGARPPKEAKKIWKELSDKKRLKYIKKAELIYDQNLEVGALFNLKSQPKSLKIASLF